MDNFFTQMFRFREVTPNTPGVPKTTDPSDASNKPPRGGNWEANVVRPVGRTSLLVPAWYRGVSHHADDGTDGDPIPAHEFRRR